MRGEKGVKWARKPSGIELATPITRQFACLQPKITSPRRSAWRISTAC
jgi:hypothetical protein